LKTVGLCRLLAKIRVKAFRVGFRRMSGGEEKVEEKLQYSYSYSVSKNTEEK
jgi:hypothetical protein